MRGIVIIYLLIGMVNLNEILVKKYYVDIDFYVRNGLINVDIDHLGWKVECWKKLRNLLINYV